MDSELKYLDKKRNKFVIKGTTDYDLKQAFSSDTVICELPDGKYIIPLEELARTSLHDRYVPQIYKVTSQGDGYVNDTSTLKQLTNRKKIKAVTHEIQWQLSEFF